MQYIVDRTEGEYAVLENESGESVSVEISRLCKADCKSGDIFDFDGNSFEFNGELTEKRRERLAKRTRSMFE